MTGNEIIEPEPEGYPEKLYMIGDEFGNWNWNSTNVVEMAPVGQLGNGAFWTIKYFNAGQGINGHRKNLMRKVLPLWVQMSIML